MRDYKSIEQSFYTECRQKKVGVWFPLPSTQVLTQPFLKEISQAALHQ